MHTASLITSAPTAFPFSADIFGVLNPLGEQGRYKGSGPVVLAVFDRLFLIIRVGNANLDHARHLARILACFSGASFEVGKYFPIRLAILSADCNQTIAIFSGKTGAVRHHRRDVKRNWIARPCIEFCLASLVRASVGYFLPGHRARISSMASAVWAWRYL